MSAKVEKLGNSKVIITVAVDNTKLETEVKNVFDKNKGNIELKGFRKGHVPFDRYVAAKGKRDLYEDAVYELLNDDFRDAVTANDLKIAFEPKIIVPWDEVGQGKNFDVKIEVVLFPEVKLGEYKNVEVEKMPVEVTDAEIQGQIKQFLMSETEILPKEEGSLELGDTAVFDFEGFVDNEPFEGGKAENYNLEIGSGQFIPGFEDQMVGMKTGEEKDVNVTFPEGYQAENLSGKPAVFKVKLHEIKYSKTPELTDEVVAKISEDEEVKTVEALTASITKDLTEKKETASKNKLIDDVVDAVTNNATFEIPEEMVAYERTRIIDQTVSQYGMDLDMFISLTGQDKATFEAEMTVHAERRLKHNLVIDQVSKDENVEATKEEIAAKFTEYAAKYNMSEDQIKDQLSEVDAKYEVIFQKTIDFLVDSANVK